MAYRYKASKRRRGKKNANPLVFGMAAVIFVLCFILYELRWKGVFEPSAKSLGDGAAYFHFLDVGQGDATLITSADGAVVIDTGGVSMGERVADYVTTYTASVDYLILTHPHEDHMGGAATLLQSVEVKNVILPNASSDAAFFGRFLDAAEELEVNVIEAVPGDVYTVGEVTLRILGPLDTTDDNLNNVSVVTRVEVGNTAALFTGDAEGEAEEALLARYAGELRCDLYQVGHHGSSTSTTGPFAETMGPDYAVISCGEGNSYGHPHRETLTTLGSLGVEVFRTDRDGVVVFVSDGVEIKPYQ